MGDDAWAWPSATFTSVQCVKISEEGDSTIPDPREVKRGAGDNHRPIDAQAAETPQPGC